MNDLNLRKSRLWLACVFAGLVMLLPSGCASLQHSVQTPRISLAGIKLVEASLGQQRYELLLHVVNPNAIPLPVRGMSYRVQLAGESFAAGETLQAFTIPANGETDFELSVTTDLLRTLSGVQRMFDQGEQTLAYQLGGQLQVDLPFVRALPFSSSGEVDLLSPLRY